MSLAHLLTPKPLTDLSSPLLLLTEAASSPSIPASHSLLSHQRPPPIWWCFKQAAFGVRHFPRATHGRIPSPHESGAVPRLRADLHRLRPAFWGVSRQQTQGSGGSPTTRSKISTPVRSTNRTRTRRLLESVRAASQSTC